MIRALILTAIHVAIATGLFYGCPHAVESIGQYPEFTGMFAQYTGMEWAELAGTGYFTILSIYMCVVYFFSKWWGFCCKRRVANAAEARSGGLQHSKVRS